MHTTESTVTDNLGIEDIVDLKVLQRIQDTFSKAMGVASVTVDKSVRRSPAIVIFSPSAR